MFFSMWGGVVADRVNRLKLIRLTRAMFSVLALLTGCLIASEVIKPWHLIVISCVTGTLLAFDGPARSAMIPALVPPRHLTSAISLYSIVSGAAAIVGPGLFAAMIKFWGIEAVFFLIGAAYALNVLTLFCMSPDGHQPEARAQSVVRGLIEGVQYIRSHRVLGSVILLAAVASVFGSCYQTLLPIFSDQILSGGVEMYSKLLLVSGVAGLLASVTMTILSPHMNPDQFVLWAGLGWGLGLLTLSTVAWWPGVAMLVGVISASRVVFQTMNTTLTQSLAADALRGRVMSVREFAWGTSAFGGFLMGAVAEGFGVPVAYGLGGGMVALTTLTLGIWMLMRRAEAQQKSLPQMEPTRLEPAKPESDVLERQLNESCQK